MSLRLTFADASEPPFELDGDWCGQSLLDVRREVAMSIGLGVDQLYLFEATLDLEELEEMDAQEQQEYSLQDHDIITEEEIENGLLIVVAKSPQSLSELLQRLPHISSRTVSLLHSQLQALPKENVDYDSIREECVAEVCELSAEQMRNICILDMSTGKLAMELSASGEELTPFRIIPPATTASTTSDPSSISSSTAGSVELRGKYCIHYRVASSEYLREVRHEQEKRANSIANCRKLLKDVVIPPPGSDAASVISALQSSLVELENTVIVPEKSRFTQKVKQSTLILNPGYNLIDGERVYQLIPNIHHAQVQIIDPRKEQRDGNAGMSNFTTAIPQHHHQHRERSHRTRQRAHDRDRIVSISVSKQSYASVSSSSPSASPSTRNQNTSSFFHGDNEEESPYVLSPYQDKKLQRSNSGSSKKQQQQQQQ